MKIIKVEGEDKDLFTDEQITQFVDFYHLLKRIHNRLVSEGYVVKDGKISKPRRDYDQNIPPKITF